MAIDLSALSNATTAAQALNNLLLATPGSSGYQPQNPPNADGSPSTAAPPPTFVFDFEGEQSVTLKSDITDHYIENNYAIQDHIALPPIVVSTHGFIGELTNVPPKFLKGLKTAADKLTVIGPYVPVLSITAIIAYNTAAQAAQTAILAYNAAVNAWSGSALNQTAQQKAFIKLSGYWSTRTLFTVQTPWAQYENMAIESLRAIQDEGTRVITDFEITFKQIRTANVTLFSAQSNTTGRASAQQGGIIDLGVGVTGPSVPFQTAVP